ncbi:ABC transporter permease subunit [Roseibaca sp. V10]|uniref:ABC transporter permease subunit n=1 Tax=Roseinatronobacter domitianus TaxID=2940293 RepID=A0ABT0LZI5_9RHOB|nr:ABC transporter permease subunit [Roseibaca domitiana]MCL1628034.1 ABC transporter permease subunit [Roseibaca domitiana]
MFGFCSDPSILDGFNWFACYLTSATHLDFYGAFLLVMVLLAVTAPAALGMGMLGALALRSRFWPFQGFGKIYVNIVRGVPDIVFFLFVPIALGQGIEWLLHQARCPDWTEPIRQGTDFLVCPEAKLPPNGSPQWMYTTYSFGMAVLAFALVFGAFVANTLHGAMQAVPHAQVETAEAYGMTRAQAFRRVVLPQMWVYALPGLSNIWQILIKATPLLFLLGLQDIVYWARELGGQKTSIFSYPHPDWRMWYFLALLVFYLFLTWASERVFAWLGRRLSHGQATAAGERQRRAAA